MLLACVLAHTVAMACLSAMGSTIQGWAFYEGIAPCVATITAIALEAQYATHAARVELDAEPPDSVDPNDFHMR